MDNFEKLRVMIYKERGKFWNWEWYMKLNLSRLSSQILRGLLTLNERQSSTSFEVLYRKHSLCGNPIRPGIFWTFKTPGGQIFPKLFPFSWTPRGSDLLKNGFTIKFLWKSIIYDQLLAPRSLSSPNIAIWRRKFFLTFRRSKAFAQFVRVPLIKIRRFWPT